MAQRFSDQAPHTNMFEKKPMILPCLQMLEVSNHGCTHQLSIMIRRPLSFLVKKGEMYFLSFCVLFELLFFETLSYALNYVCKHILKLIFCYYAKEQLVTQCFCSNCFYFHDFHVLTHYFVFKHEVYCVKTSVCFAELDFAKIITKTEFVRSTHRDCLGSQVILGVN